MPRYSYVAKDIKGEIQLGTQEAVNETTLNQILNEKGYFLIKKESLVAPTSKLELCLSFFSRISLAEKLLFVTNLQLMVSAGVPLSRAIGILAGHTENKKFKGIIEEISEKIIKGKSLFESMSGYPNVFPEIFCRMIEVGEEAGTLETVLDVLVKQMEKDYALRSKLRGAMIYPIIVFSLMLVIGIVMMITIIPKFSNLFSSMGVTLPFTTRVLIFTGNSLAKYWYLIPIVFLALFLFLRFSLKTNVGKLIWSKFSLRIPIIGSIVKKTNIAQTIRTLGSLLASGVSIVRSLEIISNTLGNIYYRRAIIMAAEDVKKGFHLAEVLQKYGNLYPQLITQVIETGEETGKTSLVLEKIAEFYEKDIDRITANLSSVVEPFLIVFIGLCVGFFALSIIQPMYGILGSV